MPTFTQDGFTALHLSSQEGYKNVVDVLIESKAHVNKKIKVITIMDFTVIVHGAAFFMTIPCL